MNATPPRAQDLDVIREVYGMYFPPEFGWGCVQDDERFVVTTQLFCEFFRSRDGIALVSEVGRGFPGRLAETA